MRSTRRKSPLVPAAHTEEEVPGDRPASVTPSSIDEDAVTLDEPGAHSSGKDADRPRHEDKRQRVLEPEVGNTSVSPTSSSVSPPPDNQSSAPALPPNALYELRARAWRILSTPEGKFKATNEPPIVKAALDGLVVLAQDAVEYHAKEERLAVRFQLKALGWLVADALGQTVPWEPDTALRVGKRLAKRVDVVRAAIAKLSDEAAVRAAMNALCPCALDELDTVCRLEPEPASHAFPSMPDSSEQLRWQRGIAGLAGMPPGLRLDAGWDPLPVSRPPALSDEHVDQYGRTRSGSVDCRRHVPSWLTERLGIEASVFVEQYWAHPDTHFLADEFSREAQDRLQAEGSAGLNLGLIACREGRALMAGFARAAAELTWAEEDLASAGAELKTLRRVDARALEMSCEGSSSDDEEDPHPPFDPLVELRRERARVEMLQASNTRLQAQLRAALQ